MDDEAFQAIYRRVQGNTLVDVYRCYELWTLAMQVYALRGDMIEIGVWRGGSGAVLAAANLKMGGKRIVYLADTFRGVVKASGKDASYVGGEHSDTSRQLVEDLLKTNSLSNVELLVLGIIVG
jgi:O-methyltransferase